MEEAKQSLQNTPAPQEELPNSESTQVNESKEQLPKATGGGGKVLRRLLLGLLLSPILLVSLLIILLYLPPIQRFVVHVVEEKVEQATGMSIDIGALHLGFPLDLSLQKVRVVNLEGDTLINLGKLEVAIPVLPLFNGQIESRRLEAEDVQVFFPDSARTMIIGGAARHLAAGPLSVNIKKERVDVGSLLFEEGGFNLYTIDTVPNPDPKPVLWKIAVNHVDLRSAKVSIEIPYSKVYVHADVTKGIVDDFTYDVETLRLEGKRVSLKAKSASYAQDTIFPTHPYVDYIHLYGYDLEVEATNFVQQNSLIMAEVSHLCMRERSGAQVKDFRGTYFMKEGLIEVEDFDVITPLSKASGSFRLPLSIFTEHDTEAEISANLKAELSDKDLFYFTTINLRDYLGTHSSILDTPIEAEIRAKGTIPMLEIETLQAYLPQIVQLKTEGYIGNFFTPKELIGALDLDLKLEHQASQLLPLMGATMAQRLSIPQATALQGKVTIDNGHYDLHANLTTLKAGNLKLQGGYTMGSNAYEASIDAAHLNVLSFLPQDSIGGANLKLSIKGNGFDPLAKGTNTSLDLDVDYIEYKGNRLDKVSLTGFLKSGILSARLNSRNPGAYLAVDVDGIVENNLLKGGLDIRIDTVAPYQLGLTTDTLALGGHLCGDFTTDFAARHSLLLEANDFFLTVAGNHYAYDSLSLRARTGIDSIMATFTAGDLFMDAYVGQGVASIGETASAISSLLPNIKEDSLINSTVAQILDLVPSVGIDVSFGYNNPLREILRKYNLSIAEGAIMLTNKKGQGLDLEANAYDVRKDTLKIDHVYASISTENGQGRASLSEEVYSALQGFIWSESLPVRSTNTGSQTGLLDKFLRLDLRVSKQRYRGQAPFSIYLRALSDFRTIDIDANYRKNGEDSYSLGAILFRNPNGFGLSFKNAPIVLAGYNLRANPQNALFFNYNKNTLLANILFKSEQNALLLLRSTDEATSFDKNRLNLNLQRLQLSDIGTLLGMPTIGGYTFADISLELDKKSGMPRLTGDVSINDLVYDNNRVGNIGAALFYEPRDNSSHFVDAQVSVDGGLSFSAEGQYHPNNNHSPLQLNAQIEHFPLSIINPFLGANLASLRGRIKGSLSAHGTVDNILVDGLIEPDSAAFYLPMVGNTFYITTPPIAFKDSRLLFNDFQLKSEGANNPFVVNGYLTLLGPKALTTELSLKGKEVQLINSKSRRGQMIYGRLLTSADLSVRGSVMKPRVRGSVDILGGTNLTYVYTQSAVKATDNMSGTVSFIEFADTLDVHNRNINGFSLGGMDLALNLHIDPAVRLGVDLSAGHQDYVSVIGGGDLHFTYPPFGEMSLTGRYDLVGGGDVRYNFPVVGRKDFVIDPDSYLSWSGNLMNPYIDFLAQQRVRANVTEGGATRKVNFEVQIVAKETVDKIDLGFDLAAPEDLSLQGKLSTMNKEERGKQAVALMVTGTFLASDATPANMQKVLSGLAVNELNSLTGKFLQGTDLDLGMELHDASETGSAYTDYTYNFSKRFYNDRLRFSIGGKVGAGNLPSNYEQTFVDNVSIEYRIDQAGSQYIKFFHKRNNDHLLEGLVTETGIGYIVRRKLEHLLDLFRRQAKAVPPIPENKAEALPKEEEASVESHQQDEK